MISLQKQKLKAELNKMKRNGVANNCLGNNAVAAMSRQSNSKPHGHSIHQA
jgi:hypothetical protein